MFVAAAGLPAAMGCGKMGSYRGQADQPDPYQIEPPAGWEKQPGKGIGPAVTWYAPQTVGAFRANIQIYEDAVADEKPAPGITAFWYEGKDMANLKSSGPSLQETRPATVAGAAAAEIRVYHATYGIHKLAQKKLLARQGDKHYVIVCSALQTNYSGYEPVFDAVLASFKLTGEPGATTQSRAAGQ